MSLLYVQIKGYRNILKSSWGSLAFTSYKTFWKTKIVLALVSLPRFPHHFWKKYFACYILLTEVHCLLAFSLWDIGQYLYCSCLLTRLWRVSFEINLTFLIKPFFLPDQKINLNQISWEKKLLRWNQKHFSSF